MTWEEYESDLPVECPVCGWKGTSKQAELELPDDTVAELHCPQCQNCKIALIESVIYPEELPRRAAAGDPWVQAYLQTQQAIENSLLKSPNQLPDLEGEGELDFVWDHEGGDEKPTTVIRLKNGPIVWKERAYFGGQERLKTVQELLKMKYQHRFRSLQANMNNFFCGLYFYGD